MIIKLIRKIRASRTNKNRKKLLRGRCPLRKAIVTRPVIRAPKKPHSAKRATVKFIITKGSKLKNYAYVLGKDGKHRLKRYDTIFFRGGRRRDIPAMKYTAVNGVRTKGGKTGSLPGLTGFIKNARSKYGAKRSSEIM